MGKQKQQTISRFFATKPPPHQDPHLPPPTSPPPPAKVVATATISPASAAKRALSKTLSPAKPSSTKKPRHHQPQISPSSPSLHQKFLAKFLEPPEASKALILPPFDPKYTPLEQQVVELKARHPDVLLMIEVGYKYRFFGEDAETAARVLGIFCHMDHNFLTASVPSFRLHFHVRRLVAAGYKVGVVKQTETAAIKAHGVNKVGPFSRGLSAVYTRSTLEAAEDLGGAGEEGLGASSSNYLMCVVEMEFGGKSSTKTGAGVHVKLAVVAVEISTGDVVYGEFEDDVLRSRLEAVLLSLAPTEILLGNPISIITEKLIQAYAGSGVRVEHASKFSFANGAALAEVISFFEKANKEASGLHHPGKATEVSGVDDSHIGIEGIMAWPELAIQALAYTMRYLQQFGFETLICSGTSFRPLSSNTEMTLSANTLHQLEIVKNNANGSMEGSLLHIMNHTCTSFGARLLRHWVTHPLCDRQSICARLDAVSEIAESIRSGKDSLEIITLEESESTSSQLGISYLLSSIFKQLQRIPDIQRGIMRIFYRTVTPAEVWSVFISVIHAILSSGKQLQQLYLEDNSDNGETVLGAVRSGLLRRLILTASSSTVIAHAAKLLSFLNKDAADKGDMLNLFIASSTQFPKVNEVAYVFCVVFGTEEIYLLQVFEGHSAVQEAEGKLNLLISHYRKQLRMPNLEFRSISGSTHLIELPAELKVPPNWVKINSTKKTIRYHPPDVIRILDQLSLASEQLAITCRATWTEFLKGSGEHCTRFQAVVHSLAALDCLHSLAILSRNQNYVRPVFVADEEPGQIEIQSGCHPVLESILGDNFVPNDTSMHELGERCQIITGPNMGGKSCYIRQVALIAIMAQVGSFVPASFAKLHVLDGIFTRMGISDNIQQGMSTFFEELMEASHILHHCSSKSLVIIDELGRGTSTHDGVAIAYATLHHLLEQNKCMILFVTHYPEIAEIQNIFVGSVRPYHVSYLTLQKSAEQSQMQSSLSKGVAYSDITFLYKLIPGVSDKSFGINVARIAQLPASCTSRATVMAGKMERGFKTRTGGDLTRCSNMKSLSDPRDIDMENQPSHADVINHSDNQLQTFSTLFKQLLLAFSSLKDMDSFILLQTLKDGREMALSMLREQETLERLKILYPQ